MRKGDKAVADYKQCEVERLLCELDENYKIFDSVELCRNGDALVLLGKGGMGWVYEAQDRENPELRYALKVIGLTSKNMDRNNFENTIRWQALIENNSKYVCAIAGSRQLRIELDEDGHVANAYELTRMDSGEGGVVLRFILFEKLTDIVGRDKFGRCFLTCRNLAEGGEKEVVRFALQIGHALKTAHEKNILHRDIKLENMFWDEELDVYKLGDFGFAKCTEDGYAVTKWGTDGYVAPEVRDIKENRYNSSADIYSFGITLYRLLNNLQYPGGSDFHVNLLQYDEKFIFPAPKNASPDMARLINRMCKYNRHERINSMSEVMNELVTIAERLNSGTGDVYDGLYEYINPGNTTTCITDETRTRTLIAFEDTTAEREADYWYQKALKNMNTRMNRYRRRMITLLTLFFLSFWGTSDTVYSMLDGLTWYHLMMPPVIIMFRRMRKVAGREITIMAGLGTLAYVAYSLYMTGISVSHVVIFALALAVMLWTNIIVYAITIAVWIVIVLNALGNASMIGIVDNVVVRVMTCVAMIVPAGGYLTIWLDRCLNVFPEQTQENRDYVIETYGD